MFRLFQIGHGGAFPKVADPDASAAHQHTVPWWIQQLLAKSTEIYDTPFGYDPSKPLHTTLDRGDVSGTPLFVQVTNAGAGGSGDGSIVGGSSTANTADVNGAYELLTHDADAKAAIEALGTALATDSKLELVRVLVASIDGKDFSTATKQEDIKTLLGTLATQTKAEAIRVLLASLDGKDFATNAKLEQCRVILASLDGKDFATNATLAAAKAVLDQIYTSVDGLETAFATLNAKDFATSAKQDTLAGKLDTTSTGLGTPSDAAAGTDTANASLIALAKRNNQNVSTVNAAIGAQADASATTDGGAFSLIGLVKRLAAHFTTAHGKQDTGNTSIASVNTNQGARADAAATTDGGTFSLIAFAKRIAGHLTTAHGKQDTGNTSLGNIDTDLGAPADAAASTDTGTFSLIALAKRGLQYFGTPVTASTSHLRSGGSNLLGWLSQLALESRYFRDEQLTVMGEVRTAEKHMILSFSARTSLSDLRFKTTLVSGGTVSRQNGGEYKLSTAATANGSASLETRRRGSYVCGLPAIAELSVRVPTAPTGTTDHKWGYYDSNNGWRFGFDATGKYVAHRANGGAETKIYQSNWNADKLDGTGASGISLNFANGVICFIEFLWFGYGPVEWGVMLPGEDGKLHRFVLHRYQTQGQLNSASPFLPLRLEVLNGATGGASDLYVGGGAFSTLGEYRPEKRTRSYERLKFALTNTANEQHLFTVRHKSGEPFESTYMPMQAVEALVSADMVVILRFNATLTGGTWGPPPGVDVNETVAEISTDTTVTLNTGDKMISTVHALQGRSDNGDRAFDEIYIPPDCTISVMVKSITPGNGQICSAIVRWFEEW